MNRHRRSAFRSTLSSGIHSACMFRRFTPPTGSLYGTNTAYLFPSSR
ncbi:hypothetical protein [Paenibacillus sp. HGF7]|nr:hypothetical protein [Paenibacillus sp. HGF7]EGL18414.1 hypothetical protein HMPREF9413_0280 [Paenibacillus sp. HGF7]